MSTFGTASGQIIFIVITIYKNKIALPGTVMSFVHVKSFNTQPSETDARRNLTHKENEAHGSQERDWAGARAGELKERGILEVSRDTSIVLRIYKLFKGRGHLDFSLTWSF